MAEDKKDPPKPAPKPAPAADAKPAAASAPAMAPTIGKSNPAQREAERRDSDRRQEERRAAKVPPTPTERAMLRLGGGLALFALALILAVAAGAGLFSWQLNLMRGQLEQVRAANHQLDQALATASRMADAAKKSADTIPDTERAYIFLDAATTALPKTVAAASPVRLGFKNYGRTPATVNGVAGRYYYSAQPPVRLALGNASVPMANAVAEGGAVGPYDIALDANDQDLARAAHGDGTIVVQAVVGYLDLFGEGHETGLCYEFQYKTGAFVPCADAALSYRN